MSMKEAKNCWFWIEGGLGRENMKKAYSWTANPLDYHIKIIVVVFHTLLEQCTPCTLLWQLQCFYTYFFVVSVWNSEKLGLVPCALHGVCGLTLLPLLKEVVFSLGLFVCYFVWKKIPFNPIHTKCCGNLESGPRSNRLHFGEDLVNRKCRTLYSMAYILKTELNFNCWHNYVHMYIM